MELTKDDIKEAVKEAMAEKLELTFGINCMSDEDRRDMRDDISFLRTLRKTAQRGGEKLFFVILGIGGAGLLAFLAPEVWKKIR